MTVPDEILTRLREVCLALPDAYEEDAWVGTRWRVRKKTFAHVLMVEDGKPPWFADVISGDGLVLTFRASAEELHALSNAGPPFFKTVWPEDMICLRLGDHIDWDEITELLTDSYLVMAPRTLARRLTSEAGP